MEAGLKTDILAFNFAPVLDSHQSTFLRNHPLDYTCPPPFRACSHDLQDKVQITSRESRSISNLILFALFPFPISDGPHTLQALPPASKLWIGCFLCVEKPFNFLAAFQQDTSFLKFSTMLQCPHLQEAFSAACFQFEITNLCAFQPTLQTRSQQLSTWILIIYFLSYLSKNYPLPLDYKLCEDKKCSLFGLCLLQCMTCDTPSINVCGINAWMREWK